MNILTNPALTRALSALEYPLPDYQAFSVAWPHTAAEIESLHRMLKVKSLAANELELIYKSCEAMVRSFGTTTEQAVSALAAFGAAAKALKEEEKPLLAKRPWYRRGRW